MGDLTGNELEAKVPTTQLSRHPAGLLVSVPLSAAFTPNKTRNKAGFQPLSRRPGVILGPISATQHRVPGCLVASMPIAHLRLVQHGIPPVSFR